MKKQLSEAEQVRNLLNVIKQHEGQYVLGKIEDGKSKPLSFWLNPLMSDGGIQPPGEPLFGPRFFDSRSEAEAVAEQMHVKRPDAEYCALPVEECVMQQELHGINKTLAEAIAENPSLAAAGNAVAQEDIPAHWVVCLDPDAVVDVALDRNQSGISEDCFITTARELIASGFGELSFERTSSGVTVFADTRKTFARLAAACE
jgi:hypothetical protein